MKISDELVIVTGANSDLALPFIDHFNKKNSTKIIALFNNNPIESKGSIIPIQCDLLSENIKCQLHEVFTSNLQDEIRKVYLMHMIGSFKYEGLSQTPEIDEDNDGIDDDVFASNITTFENLFKALQSYYSVDNYHELVLFNVGSKRDYNPDIVPWKSYALVKNILRNRFKDLTMNNKNIHALFTNAGTIDIAKERVLRPYGEYSYRLKAQEVFAGSIYDLEHVQGYKEIELYKFHPNYENTFRHETLFDTHQRWLKEMGRDIL